MGNVVGGVRGGGVMSVGWGGVRVGNVVGGVRGGNECGVGWGKGGECCGWSEGGGVMSVGWGGVCCGVGCGMRGEGGNECGVGWGVGVREVCFGSWDCVGVEVLLYCGGCGSSCFTKV